MATAVLTMAATTTTPAAAVVDNEDSTTSSAQSQFPHVLNENLMDALGHAGIYTGNTFRGMPHHKGRMMYLDNQHNVESYVGDWQLGHWHGQYGVCTLQNGDVYKGPFQKQERHGLIGEYYWKETHQGHLQKVRFYQGSFQHNQRQGHGKYVWKTMDTNTSKVISQSTYVGMFDNGLRQGHGIYTSPKLTYSGEWYQGQYHGYGVLELIKSETTKYVYKGYFFKGKKEGRGSEVAVTKKIAYSVDGDGEDDEEFTTTLVRHEGMWRQDRPVEEQLLERTAAAAVQENGGDEMKDNASNNSGDNGGQKATTVFSSFQPLHDAKSMPGTYRGIVQDGLPQGVGTMHYDMSTVTDDNVSSIIQSYEGFWQGGIHHGFGRCLYANNDLYVGQFVQWKRQGQGEYTHKRGSQINYKGLFHNNVPHGTMTVIYESLKRDDEKFLFQGTFENGQRQSGRLEALHDGGYYQGTFNNKGGYHGMGELVTPTTIYKGEFQDGLYHGKGTLRNAVSNEILIDHGEWKQGQCVSMDEKTSIALEDMLDIPQPPLDLNWENLELNLHEDQLRKNGGILTKLGASPVASPIPTKATLNVASSLFASAVGLLSSSSTTAATETKKEEDETAACHAVVDLAVWDGQDNPGRYTGLLHIASQRPHGVGRMVYNDGNRIHEGFWEYGHRQGHGRCLFVQIGDYHEGDYHANLRHGPGKYYWKDGRQYIGMYHNDERHGKNGKFIYPNGDVYEGDFAKGQRSGYGVFVFNKKTCSYKGMWKHGVYHGKGHLQWKTPKGDDQEYQGEFSQGLFHGGGEERIKGNVIRKGQYAKGRMIQQEKVAAPLPDQVPVLEVLTTTMDDDNVDNNKEAEDEDGDREETTVHVIEKEEEDEEQKQAEGEDHDDFSSLGDESNHGNNDDEDEDGEPNEDGEDDKKDSENEETQNENDDKGAGEMQEKPQPRSRSGRARRETRKNGVERKGGADIPSRATSTASTLECPTSTQQTFEANRVQWKKSLEPENN